MMPGIARGSTIRRIVCHLLAPHAYDPSRIERGTDAGTVDIYVAKFDEKTKPTADQDAALAEWHVAYAVWERTRLCLQCGTTFVPPNVGT